MERVARTTRTTTKALERENLHDRERSPIIHDLEASEMGEWEGLWIPKEEFDGVRKTRERKGEARGIKKWHGLLFHFVI